MYVYVVVMHMNIGRVVFANNSVLTGTWRDGNNFALISYKHDT